VDRLGAWGTRLPALARFGEELTALGWVTDLLVAGSLATGDHVAGVSDLDLVALTDGPVGQLRARRRGEAAVSQRLRTAVIAWRDASGRRSGLAAFDRADRR
jgi:hypothetical protein